MLGLVVQWRRHCMGLVIGTLLRTSCRLSKRGKCNICGKQGSRFDGVSTKLGLSTTIALLRQSESGSCSLVYLLAMIVFCRVFIKTLGMKNNLG